MPWGSLEVAGYHFGARQGVAIGFCHAFEAEPLHMHLPVDSQYVQKKLAESEVDQLTIRSRLAIVTFH